MKLLNLWRIIYLDNYIVVWKLFKRNYVLLTAVTKTGIKAHLYFSLNYEKCFWSKMWNTHFCFSFFCDAIFESVALKTMPDSQRVLSLTRCGDSMVCRHSLAKKIPEPSQKITFSVSP